VKQPGQSIPDTLSYDRSRPQEGAGLSPPAAQPDYLTTSVLPENPAGSDAGRAQDPGTGRERPIRMDPLAVGPAPQVPLSLSPPQTPAPQPASEAVAGAFRAGEQVDHFEIVSLVGRGGMGCVYKAFDRDLGRTVAIKTLHGIDQHQPNTLARFRREAQAASRVVHPNLVIIYSSGTHGDTPYIVMEYLSGCSLAAEIAEGPLSVERTADVLVAACAGVHAAHRANVVHRDLKPANIFLARTPMGETPKILDFGISRFGDDDASLTGTGDIIGTTYYLAPEQAAGSGVDARADQHALGVILYECLTGVRPFDGPTAYAIMRNIVEGIFQPPSRLRPDIPRGLEAVILRAMSRAPDDRFARVRDLALALMPFMSAQGRQQWSYHFIAPEAEMPIAHSAAVPAPAGAEARPVSTEIAPVERPAPAPTKILPVGQPEPWQVVPTRAAPAAVSVPAPAPTTVGELSVRHRGRVVALLAAVVALLALATWALRGSFVRDTAPPTSSSAATVEKTPPPPVVPAASATPQPEPATPVVPAPSVPEPSPPRAAPSRPADNPPKPAPRKPKKSSRSSVKFTPEGVPII
jgi:serine/threonine-protein kinase